MSGANCVAANASRALCGARRAFKIDNSVIALCMRERERERRDVYKIIRVIIRDYDDDKITYAQPSGNKLTE